MTSPYRQRGLTALSMLVILLVAVFFGTCAIKVGPLYIDNMSIQRSVESVVDEATTGNMSIAEMKGKLSKLFQVNMTEALDVKSIKITRKSGVTTVDARYERRIALMFNIDVVIKFDHLLYEFSGAAKK